MLDVAGQTLSRLGRPRRGRPPVRTPDPMAAAAGARLALARIGRNLSRDDCAKALGVSLRSWNNYESGGRAIYHNADALRAACDLFKLPVDVVMFGRLPPKVGDLAHHLITSVPQPE